jgi:hypothetical protein
VFDEKCEEVLLLLFLVEARIVHFLWPRRGSWWWWLVLEWLLAHCLLPDFFLILPSSPSSILEEI